MEKAAAFVRDAGGPERARVFTHVAGARRAVVVGRSRRSSRGDPATASCSNIYDFACWRQTIVALTVVAAHRPSRPLPFARRAANR